MTRQNINIGTNLNDGTGDKLRDAMQKVNENFIELYAATLSTGNISVANSTIGTTNVSDPNLKLTPTSQGNVDIAFGLNVNTENSISGFKVWSSNSSDVNPVLSVNTVTKQVDLIGNLVANNLSISNHAIISGNVTLGTGVSNILEIAGRINGDVIPSTDNTRFVGSPSNRFTGGYFSNVNATAISASDITTTEANVNILRVADDSFLGDLLIRNNMISNRVPNDDIEIRPDGTGNVYVTTKLIVGSGSTPMTNPVLQATGDADNFTQIGVQNKNSGKFACSDIVVFTNEGSDFYDFVDMGQNNSGWDGSLQYVYFDKGADADDWVVGQTVYQLDPSDGSSILARGQIDEIITNPLNSLEWRIRVCNVFEGTTGIFEQNSTAGVVYNETASTTDSPKDHLVETITSDGSVTYNLGTHTLNSSTARAAFAPTVILSNDSCVVKVNGTTQAPGVDYTIQFNKIKFFTVPTAGATITIRQYPDANYPFTVGQSADSYLYNNGKKFTIGTMTGDDVVFHVNGVRFTAEAGRIKGASKNWIFGNGVTDKDGFSDTGETIQVHGDARFNSNLVIQNRTVSSSVGVAGDKAGMVAMDADYIYRCIANYDGSTNIWTRVALSATPW
jgi:hypothetical protein